MVTQIDDRRLEKLVREAVTPVCITFFACESNPCKNLMPELEAAENQLNSKMEFYTIDISENPRITDKLRVNAVPTMIIYRDGGEIARYDGVHSSETLIKQFTVDLDKKE